MIVKINTVELVDALAWERLKLEEGFSSDDEAEDVMLKPSGDSFIFKDNYQDRYNDLNDYYSTIIDKVIRGE